MEYVVIVDSQDLILGIEEKLLAHQKGTLHRAVSVCLFDSEGRWLMQKRASGKYHSPGKWANSCCSHPRLLETPHHAACRRIKEELGAEVSLTPRGSFLYREEVGHGLVEHEYDYLFTGACSKELLHLNPAEVEEIDFFSTEELSEKLTSSPKLFAPWFPYVFSEVLRTL